MTMGVEGPGVGEVARAALMVAFFSRFCARGAFPGGALPGGALLALPTLPGGALDGVAFFAGGGTFARGHSRSLLRMSRDPATHSSRRLLKCSQWTKYSHWSSGCARTSGWTALFRLAYGLFGLSRMERISARRSSVPPDEPGRRI